jgi:hypothetical protein
MGTSKEDYCDVCNHSGCCHLNDIRGCDECAELEEVCYCEVKYIPYDKQETIDEVTVM